MNRPPHIPRPSRRLSRNPMAVSDRILPYMGSAFQFSQASSPDINSNKLSKLHPSSLNQSFQSRPQISPFKNLSKQAKSHSYKPKQLPLIQQTIDVQVYMMSNWGDENEIRCSEIDFLDQNRLPIKVIRVTPEDPNEDKTVFRTLANGELIKSPTTKKFVHSWSKNHKPIIINYTLDSLILPEYIRVWNSKDGKESNLRKFAVFIEEELYCIDEALDNYGVILPLILMRKEVHPEFNDIFKVVKHHEKLFDDEFGILPIPLITKLRIRLLSSYYDKSTSIGLNSIDLYDIHGNILTKDDLEELDTIGCENVLSPEQLFNNQKNTVYKNDMWYAKKLVGDYVDIIITLKKPTQIVLINIWNFNYDIESKVAGASNAVIFADDKYVIRRHLKPANGTVKGAKEGITSIWLSDSYDFVKYSNDNIKTKLSFQPQEHEKVENLFDLL